MQQSSGTFSLERDGKSLELFGHKQNGLVMVEFALPTDDLTFYCVFHEASAAVVGLLFCNVWKAQSIFGELADAADWIEFKNWDDISAEAEAAIGEFRTRHLFLERLPAELRGVIARTDDPDAKTVRKRRAKEAATI